jgi:hypothetical protein
MSDNQASKLVYAILTPIMITPTNNVATTPVMLYKIIIANDCDVGTFFAAAVAVEVLVGAGSAWPVEFRAVSVAIKNVRVGTSSLISD